MKNRLNYLFLTAGLLMIALTTCGGDDNRGNGGEPGHGSGGENPPIAVNDYKYTKPAGCLRLMTYNSFYCKSNTGTASFTEEHTKAFASVIKSLDPDIIAIQELDSNCTQRNKRYLLQEIKDATGTNYQIYFGSAAEFDGGRIGCGVMVKRSLNVVKVKYVALPGDESRKLIEVMLPNFSFFTTHLDLNNQKRRSSVEIIKNEMNDSSVPVFLAGDLNDSPSWETAQSAFPLLTQSFTIISATEGSLPDQPNTTIDYILLDTSHKDKVVVSGTHVVKRLSINGEQKDISTVSDHYPVYVDMKIK
ncbi:endonuclease/exonuclease/phosphatase family protein [Prevotella sp. KH2C16]|uniref:endonuclease/exonuclease/phosphatase family protein n=1 Tax=Prevotella sp. KH2C16 TaxID=1855325 RepID=UPI0008EB4C3A|nr:endonuclease/exonuclease/phosphatase family protein [Prevotella sp. KH2C16]SFF84357.1 Metal-dependent hydrolase, endonuclease/exonuclease/phosphatase family [Prevotella sp. KH2C16]